MSLLIVLVMAVVATTYSVSGTYAKYTSKIDFTDEARVAKWELLLDGQKATTTQNVNLFKESYSVDGKGLYVESINQTDRVVAPGTTGFYELNLSGNMEVRYQLAVNIADDANDFVVYYNVDGDNKVTGMSLTKDGYDHEYHPLRYSITKADGSALAIPVNKLTFAQLKEALKSYNSNNSYAPGAFTKNYKITWTWDAVNANDGSAVKLTDTGVALAADEINKLDTFAGENLSANADKVTYNVSVVATQVAEDYAK